MNAQANKKKKRRSRDVNQRAASIVAEATSDEQEAEEGGEQPEDEGKNPAAVALGRLGGKKGGKARAAKLSAERRREIAQKAAQARWKKEEEDG